MADRTGSPTPPPGPPSAPRTAPYVHPWMRSAGHPFVEFPLRPPADAPRDANGAYGRIWARQYAAVLYSSFLQRRSEAQLRRSDISEQAVATERSPTGPVQG